MFEMLRPEIEIYSDAHNKYKNKQRKDTLIIGVIEGYIHWHAHADFDYIECDCSCMGVDDGQGTWP